MLIADLTDGFLEITKWLYEIKPNINVSINNDEAFKNACKNNHLEVAMLLTSIYPNRYKIIKYDKNVIEYNININLV